MKATQGKVFKQFPMFFISHQGPTSLFEKNSPHVEKLRKIDSIIQPFKKDIKAVIFVSAHNTSSGKTLVLGNEQLETIHDHGFEQVYSFRYSPKGHPEVAKEIVDKLNKAGVSAELSKEWGADHALWSLMPIFYRDPKDLNVVMISVDIDSGEENIANVGRVLAQFREKKCLIISSGTMTHNIRLAFMGENQQSSMTGHVEQQTISKVNRGPKKLISSAHPSDEHWLPLIFSIGAAENTLVTEQVWKYEDLPGLKTHAFMFYNNEDKEDL